MPAGALTLAKRQSYDKRTSNLTKKNYVSTGFLFF
jgi:hypothetical protein